MDIFCPTDSVTRTISVPSKSLRPDAWSTAKAIAVKHGAKVGVGSESRDSARLLVRAKFTRQSWHASNEAGAAFIREWCAWAEANGLRCIESIGPQYWAVANP